MIKKTTAYRGYIAANGLHENWVSLRAYDTNVKRAFVCPKALILGEQFQAQYTSLVMGRQVFESHGAATEVSFRVDENGNVINANVLIP